MISTIVPMAASGRGVAPPLLLFEDLGLARFTRKEGTVITLWYAEVRPFCSANWHPGGTEIRRDRPFHAHFQQGRMLDLPSCHSRGSIPQRNH